MDFAEGLKLAAEILLLGFLSFVAVWVGHTLHQRYLFWKYRKARHKYQLTIAKEKEDNKYANHN
jgi:hypothetical protein